MVTLSAGALVAYVWTVTIVSGSPGPAMLYALSTGIHHGRARGIFTILGSLAGSLIVLGGACVGVATAARVSPEVLLGVKVTGAAYLIWLGWRTWPRGPVESVKVGTPVEVRYRRELFGTAFIVAITNPKAYIFFIALFSQFVDYENNILEQLLFLSIIFIVIEVIWQYIYIMLGERAARFLEEESRIRWLGRIVACVFIALGVGVLVHEVL